MVTDAILDMTASVAGSSISEVCRNIILGLKDMAGVCPPRFMRALVSAIREIFPLKPNALISHLNLLRPIYKKTAAYGHFGRTEPEFSWEKTNMVDELKKLV